MSGHDHSHHQHGHDHSGHGSMGGMSSMNMTTTSPATIVGSDHSGHGDHSMMDGDGSASMHPHNMMMHMYFHGGVDETILFEFWKISDTAGLFLSMIVIFFLAFGYEGLKFYREHLYRHSFQTIQLSTVAVPVENGTVRETHKTVQIGTTSISNCPYNPEMNPIFLTHTTCECDSSSVPGQKTCSMECGESVSRNMDSNDNEDPYADKKKMCIPFRAGIKVKVFSMMHCWQTVLHIFQMIISYFLMLIFMTYNIWLCLAVALGAGAGYFSFGWKKSVVVDVTEHCH